MISRFAKLARHEKRATQRVRCSFRHLIWKIGYKCFKLSLKVRWWRRYCTSSLWSWQTNRSSGRRTIGDKACSALFFEYKGIGGYEAGQGGDGGIEEVVGPEGVENGLQGALGGVVVLAEVTEPDGGEVFAVLCDETGGAFIGEVPARGEYAVFEAFRIGATQEHEGVVVGFDDEVCGACYVGFYFWCNVAAVGEEAEAEIVVGDEVSATVAAVVRHVERFNGGSAEAEGLVLLYEVEVVAVGLVAYGRVVEDALEGEFCESDVDVPPFALCQKLQCSGVGSVVHVVVGQEYGFQAGEAGTAFGEAAPQPADGYAGVDEETSFCGLYEIAVAATAAPEASEVEHLFFFFCCCRKVVLNVLPARWHCFTPFGVKRYAGAILRINKGNGALAW